MPILFLAVPLIAVVILSLAIRLLDEKIALWVAIIIAVMQAILAAFDIHMCLNNVHNVINDMSFTEMLSVDTLSAVVLFTIGLIAFVALIVAKSTVKGSMFNFANMILLVMLGMNGLAMATDLFSMYVFVEITSTASFILIGIKKGTNGLSGAFKYYMMSAVASVLMLTSIALILMQASTTDINGVAEYLSGLGNKLPVFIIISFILYTAGLAIKSGVFPFHTWVPNAYSSSPAPVSVLLAGIVTKVSGVYVLMRIFRDVFLNNAAIGRALMAMGIASILIGAFAAIGHKDMKRMLAYSSISQIGYIIIGISTGSPLGFAGAILHFFNHATFKSLLFVNFTAIELKTGQRDMDNMGGLAEKMPVTGTSSIIAFLSTAGIPPLSGFWSKLLIILAVWKVSSSVAIAALAASIITLWYFLQLQKKVYYGEPNNEIEGGREASAGILGVEVLLSSINVAAGVLFPLILLYISHAGII